MIGTNGGIGDDGAQPTGHAKLGMGCARLEVQKAGIAQKTGHRPISVLFDDVPYYIFIWAGPCQAASILVSECHKMVGENSGVIKSGLPVSDRHLPDLQTAAPIDGMHKGVC